MKPKLAAALLLLTASAVAQSDRQLGDRIQQIINRPEYKHSRWGMEFYSLDDKQVLFSMNSDQLFLPGSTGKLYPQATGLATFGPDYRFHTKLFRTGPVVNGALKGDLVLVASGDPNLSNRIQPDGTLAFRHPDHSYDQISGAAPLPGDPLLPVREIADQVAAKGIKRIEGHVVVDSSLFPERPWIPAAPLFVVSSIVINDNIVDVTVSPGDSPSAPAVVRASPETRYVHFINQTKTIAAGNSPGEFRFANDVANPDGTHTLTVVGSVPAGKPALYHAYFVREPTRYAQMALTEALKEKGIESSTDLLSKPDFKAFASSYTLENQVAEHVSPPLSEEVKVTLKLSQNLHASMMLDLLGSISGHDREHPVGTGLGFERKLFEAAGLDVNAAAQNEGAGTGSEFTPDFTVHFLEYVSRQPFFQVYYDALPILGKDGSLAETQVDSPAAGHIHAKTGTGIQPNMLNRNLMLETKALAGYIDAPNGHKVAFAIYVNYVPVSSLSQVLERSGPGEAVGEIASLVWESLIPSAASKKKQKGVGKSR